MLGLNLVHVSKSGHSYFVKKSNYPLHVKTKHMIRTQQPIYYNKYICNLGQVQTVCKIYHVSD